MELRFCDGGDANAIGDGDDGGSDGDYNDADGDNSVNRILRLTWEDSAYKDFCMGWSVMHIRKMHAISRAFGGSNSVLPFFVVPSTRPANTHCLATVAFKACAHF